MSTVIYTYVDTGFHTEFFVGGGGGVGGKEVEGNFQGFPPLCRIYMDMCMGKVRPQPFYELENWVVIRQHLKLL